MKTLIPLLIVWLTLTSTYSAEWKRLEPIKHMPGGQSRELSKEKKVIYSYDSAFFNEAPDKRLILHCFHWKGEIVLRIEENEWPEAEHPGNEHSTTSDMAVDLKTVDFDRDGLVDVVRIGAVTDLEYLLFGRCNDGIFSLIPKSFTINEIKDFLKRNNSEQAVVAEAKHPAE